MTDTERRSGNTTIESSGIQAPSAFIPYPVLHDLLGRDYIEDGQDLSAISPDDWWRLLQLKGTDRAGSQSFERECLEARKRILALETSVTTASQMLSGRDKTYTTDEGRHRLVRGRDACKSLSSTLPGRSRWHDVGHDFNFIRSKDGTPDPSDHPLTDPDVRTPHVELDTIGEAHDPLTLMGTESFKHDYSRHYVARSKVHLEAALPALMSARGQLESLIDRYQEEVDCVYTPEGRYGGHEGYQKAH